MFSGPFPSDDAEADRDLRQALDEASPETLKSFVLLAVLIQAGLFAGSLGVMLVAFRDQWVVGGVLVVGGLLALGFAVVRYRRRKRSA